METPYRSNLSYYMDKIAKFMEMKLAILMVDPVSAFPIQSD